MPRSSSGILAFPKPGINFKDITPILQNAEAFKYIINKLAKKFKNKNVNIVASEFEKGGGHVHAAGFSIRGVENIKKHFV